MLEELLVAAAEIVLAWVAVAVCYETVLRTLAVAGELPATFLALLRQRLVFEFAETLLLLAVEHLGDGFLAYVAQSVFGEHEVVAGVDVAVELHHAGVSALLGIHADAGRHAHPVSKHAVEQLHVYLAHVVAHPLVEDGAEEASPLFRRDAHVGKRRVCRVGDRGEMASVSVLHRAFNDRRELQELASVLLEEAVEVERIVGVEVVHHRHRVPLHAVLLQQAYAVHHLLPCLCARGGAAELVVKLLRSVDGYSDEPVVLAQEATPLVVEQRAVGLYRVGYASAHAILTLQLHRLPIERKWAHERFAAVPCEEDVGRGLRLDVFLGELLEHLLREHAFLHIAVEVRLLKIVAVFAAQVAGCAYWLEHHVERTRKGRYCRHMVVLW